MSKNSTYLHLKKKKKKKANIETKTFFIKPEISAGFPLHFMDYYYIPQRVHYIKMCHFCICTAKHTMNESITDCCISNITESAWYVH